MGTETDEHAVVGVAEMMSVVVIVVVRVVVVVEFGTE
jgi:hypothetical protein